MKKTKSQSFELHQSGEEPGKTFYKGTGKRIRVTEERQMLLKKYFPMIRSREENVVDGYKKIEETIVSGFRKISDGFVEHYLTREGETAEEARERLVQEQKERQEEREAREGKKSIEKQQQDHWKKRQRAVVEANRRRMETHKEQTEEKGKAGSE